MRIDDKYLLARWTCNFDRLAHRLPRNRFDFEKFNRPQRTHRPLSSASFALLSLKVFAACANFPVAGGYPKIGFTRAKTPSTPSPEV
jgi:hypothetical protein